ncbi:hypothetical protein [Microbacterium capsulatum]|uniref:Allantoicase domain-containing protein n=1 Tax=Microbacterium capsulatum TaxID=3041921 RepID=A0ABU0XED8_9MICO|nr:hypothetical protein [Microbacterium sp. ASV81]MDQ4212550.1 hypothetical protein [Microbacterium sp. ASV81]
METRLNLASKRLGASVMATTDEHFGAAEHLVKDSESVAPDRSRPGPRGTVYDGWETRRHTPEEEWALVRLGAPGIVHEVIADTAHFHGNVPVAVELESFAVDGYPTSDEVLNSPRRTLVSRSACGPDQYNVLPSEDGLIATHLLLRLLPDGGVSRLRAYGEVVLDPRRVRPSMDLASVPAGGHVVSSSTAFMPPTNVLMPRTAASIGEGWETGRRRGAGHDEIVIGLADVACLSAIEIDTTHFGGNAADAFSAEYLPEGASGDVESEWRPLMPRTRLLSDQRHAFPITEYVEAARVRVRIHPDGGISAVRLFGDLVPRVRGRVIRRWLAALPEPFVRGLARSAELSAHGSDLLAGRGVEDRGAVLLDVEAAAHLDGLTGDDADRFDRLFYRPAASWAGVGQGARP